MTKWIRMFAVGLLTLSLGLGACSSDSDSDGASDDDSTTVDTGGDSADDTSADTADTADTADDTTGGDGETLNILLTNDDGVEAEGIDAVATALRELPNTEVTVIAPAENQSGTGDRTTDGTLTVEETTTASGYEAIAVDGFPADSVVWALEEGDLEQTPDLVVSGINEGQNIGPVAALSGTVGAAREASRRGIPSLGASSGVVNPNSDNEIVEYDEAVDLVVEWVESNREELLARPDSTEPADVANLNVPTCVTGEMRGQVEVPVATAIGEGVNIFVTDCTSTVADPPDDVVAFINGYAPLSEINVVELDALLGSVNVNE